MVKQGYKQTELGLLPGDWKVVPFHECFDIVSNNTFSRAELSNEGNVKNIHYGDILIQYNEIVDCESNDIPYLTEQAEIKAKNTFLKNGDVVIADTAEDETVGKAVEIINADKPIVAGLHTIPCRPKFYGFASKWLGYYMNSQLYHKQLLPYITGTKVSAISKQSIKNTLIVIPPFEQQEKHVDYLSAIDELISNQEKLIEKKKAIKQGVMQELLTGKKRLEGFTGQWKTVQLSSIGKITSNGVDKKTNPNELIVLLLNYTDVYHKSYLNQHDLNHIVSAPKDKVINCSVKKGDVFFTPTSETPNDIAKTAVSLEDMKDVVYSYHIVRLRPGNNYDGQFIKWACSTDDFYNQAYKNSDGSGTRYVISVRKFESMTIKVPNNIEEQKAVSNIIFEIENEIIQQEQKLEKYKQLKQAMMEQLLTGKIRLV